MKNMKQYVARTLLFAVIAAGVVFAALSASREANLIAGVLALLVLGVVMSFASSREKFAMPDPADLEMDRIAASQEPSSSGSRLAVTRLDDSAPSSVSNVTPIRRGGIDWGDFERQVREARALLAPRVQYDPFAVSAELTGEVPEFHPTGKTSRINIGERYPILRGLS